MWQKMTPAEIKYSIRMMEQRSLRIGFDAGSMEAAVSNAFSQKRDEVKRARIMTGSIGETAVLARRNKLSTASFRLFHPVLFMLASPLENRSVKNPDEYLAEEKFDGMRAQVHADGGRAEIYNRDLNRITNTFPDLAEFFAKRTLSETVIDGEICVYKDDTIMPFQFLQKRTGLKKPGKKIIAEYPVLFVAYDLLCLKGEPISGLPLFKRRQKLERLAETAHIPVAAQYELAGGTDIDELFERALNHGNEGLVLKQKESTYEYGQRSQSWLKVKKPGGSFDTVIMYAHADSGKRGGLYSGFTLGIRVKDDGRFEEEFIPIGKVYGGCSDEELKKLNNEIKKLAAEKYGPTLGLLPGIVVEIEFDDIRENRRTKAGYTLRFPCFKRIRWDLSPEDTHTLKDVETLYRRKINRESFSQGENPSFHFPGK
jgi:DNA ligase-1